MKINENNPSFRALVNSPMAVILEPRLLVVQRQGQIAAIALELTRARACTIGDVLDRVMADDDRIDEDHRRALERALERIGILLPE